MKFTSTLDKKEEDYGEIVLVKGGEPYSISLGDVPEIRSEYSNIISFLPVVNLSSSQLYSNENNIIKIYLNEIGKYELLEPEEEKELSARIQNAKKNIADLENLVDISIDQLRGIYNFMMSNGYDFVLLKESNSDIINDSYKANRSYTKWLIDKVEDFEKEFYTARDKLVKSNLRFVVDCVVKNYPTNKLSFLDLINEGNSGLIIAAEHFDGSLGFKFCTYAVWWIRQAILRALSDKSRNVRIPIHRQKDIYDINKITNRFFAEYGREPTIDELSKLAGFSSDKVKSNLVPLDNEISLNKIVGEDNDTELIDLFGENDKNLERIQGGNYHDDIIYNELKRLLTNRERFILYDRFGKERTLNEVGVTFKISRERVRQIQANAIKKLKKSKTLVTLHQKRSDDYINLLMKFFSMN